MVASPLVSRWHDGSYRRHQQNGLVAAVNIADFTELEAYKTDVEALITEIKKLPKADGVEEILVPGERSDRIMAERERLGIPVPIKTWLQVCEVAERFSVRIPKVKDIDD